MSKPVIRTLVVISAIVVLFACSQKSEESYADIEQRSLESWINLYVPQAERFGDKMFIERLKTNPSGKPVEADKWVMVSYQGMTMEGHTFVSRYGEPLKIEGSYSRRAYYGPAYMPVYEVNSGFSMSNGQHEILMTMHEGDSVRAYIPSSLNSNSMGSSSDDVYLGQFSKPANSPTIWIIKVEEVIDDPHEHELKEVENYATLQWGMELTDTLSKGFYFQVTREAPGDEEYISKDSKGTIRSYYAVRLINGFLLDTNIDSIAVRGWGPYEPHNTLPYHFKIMMDDPEMESDLVAIPAFDSLGGRIRYNEWARMVFISEFGYGVTGTSTINPYTPLVFDLYILPEKDE